ncbi:histidine phosphatase family protein [Faecalicatena sp. AGMB00832]|uniref:Histidine phosphatase family protein n=1 Tax=Faecalicatena faecalis TaxID=2726362 RepID=A0ABS6D8M4_9FIRM|nr:MULTISPECIES: histidine phosphatase family protein [Faecalicatena]MBU3877952.1 histidine phosphatase family protein [Faecalicatena faecalis]MCI6466841.1 histidine phosphatase family protein [Faecalicatena sp.]MDY5619661.1 histidine phosphatase family protein [Lachnospiraceae bacterium]
MKLYLVRHGETPWNKLRKVQGHSDIPLNEYGRYLAEQTALGLREVDFSVAYTSPLIRARQTAEIILAGRDISIYDEPRIQEMGFGVCEGMCCRGENKEPGSDEFNKLFTDTANYQVPEGGESIQEVEARVQSFLEEVYKKEELQDKNILISTHGAALTAMLNCIKNKKELADFWEMGVPKNCSVTEVQVIDGKPEILVEGKIFY